MFAFSQISQSAYGSPGLNLTIAVVVTNRDNPYNLYYIESDKVQINGNLTADGLPVSDRLVALEVNNCKNYSVVIRTLQTGTAPISGAAINITDLFLCDQYGKPVSSIKKGSTFPYFNVTVENIGNESVPLLIAINFYQDLYPFYTIFPWIPLNPPLYPGDRLSIVSSFTIPEWVSVGNVTMYAGAFSTYPRLGGYPYCQEKSSTFKIVDSPGTSEAFSATNQPSNTNGTYSFIFKIPPDAMSGDYTAHASARYGSQQVTNHTTIKVKLPGDSDDDGKVGFRDLFDLAASYGSKLGDSNWNQDCDFNGDGRVGFADLFTLAAFYGRKATKCKSAYLKATIIINSANNTLNLQSQGKWINTYIELPNGYDVNEIDISTILLNVTIPIDLEAPVSIGDFDNDASPDLMVKFDREAVVSYILDLLGIPTVKFSGVTLTITGRLSNTRLFKGSKRTRIIWP